MSEKAKNKSLYSRFDILLTPVFLIFTGTIIHGLIEYGNGGYGLYFFRNATVFFSIVICFALYKASVVGKSFVLIFSVYAIVAAILVSFLFGYYDTNFDFEPLFLKTELIFVLLIFTIGILVHFKHILFLIAVNIGLALICCFTVARNYPIVNLLFFTLLVSGAGLIVYIFQKRNIELKRKIKRTNKLLLVQNEQLKTINQSKDHIFRIIGHDLRTPFHQLKSLAEMIKEVKNEKERLEIEELIKESAEKGYQLLEDLLSWSIYEDQSKIFLEKLSLYVIVESVFKFSEQEIKSKEIDMINNVPKSLELMLNSTMMETILRNLISNAIKFSNVQSKIEVSCEQSDKKVKISITDNGIGMTKEYIDKLFLEDQNISMPGTNNEAGTGFGLSIVKRLVEKQNGELKIESNLNQGTAVHIYFGIN